VSTITRWNHSIFVVTATTERSVKWYLTRQDTYRPLCSLTLRC
ncbi:hypothetical protein D046_2654B, partial [Vibrio parahaemolyticus V-223/04]